MSSSVAKKTSKRSISQDKVVYFVDYLILTLFAITVLYPLIYIVGCSFSSGDALMSGRVTLFPVEPTLDGYKSVFGYSSIWTGYRNSIVYTITATVISLVLTLFAAYPLSRDDFMGGGFFMKIFVFTMMFSGGMIPSYLLVKSLKMLDTMWAVVLPSSVSAYNMIVARTFFKQTIPKEILEAAEVDGCRDFRFFIQIVLPLSKPIIAVLCLWVVVANWNSYFWPMLYLNSEDKLTLQLVLRRILLMSKVDFSKTGSMDLELITKNQYLSEMLKYGTIILSSIPLMIIYPFVQKYFVQGVMLGSVKG